MPARTGRSARCGGTRFTWRDASGDAKLAVQPLLAGGEHVTAWRQTTQGSTRTLYTAVAWSHPNKTAGPQALRAVRSVTPLWVYAQDHRNWWHQYYQRSFLSISDGRLQSFYWIQLYKIASAARETAPVMATCGPWLESTPWPATWWNLNVQLEYWLIHGSNHMELDAVTYALDRYRQNLNDQVAAPYRADSYGIPRTTDMTLLNGAGTGNSGYAVGIPGKTSPTPEVGNLTWALHNVWLSYQHTMDIRTLRDVLFPLLRGAINYYLHFLAPGTDGKLHLPFTFSPEYGENAPDCNYDLALIRWGCATLLESARVLKIDDPLARRWREVLATLVPYPVDANGYMIGAGVPFAKSHRHYSHLLQIYPLYEITWEDPANRALIEKSLEHWISFEGALQGYSFTGAASISAQMLRGDKAAFYLGELLRRFVQPNTMYKESGPVIETPLSAAQSVHDMLCQSWGGVIRLFPAVAWPDVSMQNFRTQGAFLLSASRQGGQTRWLRVHSEAGAPCVLRTGISGELAVRDRMGRDLPWREVATGTIEVDLPRGQEAVIHRKNDRPDFEIAPVPAAPSARWGLP
jgi:alpha-L-fucosidase 2